MSDDIADAMTSGYRLASAARAVVARVLQDPLRDAWAQSRDLSPDAFLNDPDARSVWVALQQGANYANLKEISEKSRVDLSSLQNILMEDAAGAEMFFKANLETLREYVLDRGYQLLGNKIHAGELRGISEITEHLKALEATGGESERPKVTPLFDLKTPSDDRREITNLLGNGFLRRGQGGLWVGPTGIGKSVITTQASCDWGSGRASFGIRPQSALRILIVQSENDDDDLVEMRDGIVSGVGYTPAELADIRANVLTYRSFKSGRDWLAEIAPIVSTHKPDIIFADPLFAYAGVDIAKDQPGLSAFLREMVQPFVLRENCGIIFIHHTNKPPSTANGKSQWQAGDFAYSGSGHNELANWPRFVITLRSLGSRSVYELRIGKRWKRAGIADAQGNPTDRVLIQHSREGICWKTATETDLARSLETSPSAAAITPKADEYADKIAAAFHATQRKGRAELETVAKRVKVSEKTIRRQFSEAGILRCGEDVLRLSNSVISLVIEEAQSAFE